MSDVEPSLGEWLQSAKDAIHPKKDEMERMPLVCPHCHKSVGFILRKAIIKGSDMLDIAILADGPQVLKRTRFIDATLNRAKLTCLACNKVIDDPVMLFTIETELCGL